MEEEDESNASSNVILKLPLSHLKFLRSDFESDEEGLSLDDFLLAMVEHTKFDNVEEIISILPSMIDFFKDVDINGDGQMDWGEFTQSIVASIEKIAHVHNENLVLMADLMIQKPPAHNSCSCCAIVPELKRTFVCIQDDITMFGLNEQSSNLLTAPLKKIKLKTLNPTDKYNLVSDDAPKPPIALVVEEQQLSKKQPSAILDARPLQTPYVLNMSYIASLSVLCILRSDNSVEFLRLIVRASQSSSMSEAIEHLGVVMLGNAFTSCAVRDLPKHPVLFFAVGCDSKTYYWNVTMKTSHIALSPQPRLLCKHSDYVLDLVTISTDSFKVLVSCGMDKKIRMWDLATMHYKAYRSYVSGLLCLAFDSKSIIIAAACDCNIVGWDMDSQIDSPLFKLCGHTHPVHKLVGLGNVQRCVSLDSEGTVIYWDIKKSGIDDEERLIKEVHTGSSDKLSTFGVFQNVSSRYKGIVMVAQGKQQHVYAVQDSTPNESPPITSLFTAELLMVISIHTKNIVQWNVLNGKQIKSFVYCPETPNCELVCGVLADRNRKFVTGDSLGNIHLYSCLSIQLLRRFAHFPCAIKHLTYCLDNNVICVCNPGKIFVLDSSLNNVPDNSPEYVLRDVDAHSVDVMCMVFSRELGLIATADSDGIIKVWIYTTLMLDAVLDVKHITSTGDFSQMSFMAPYPLLLVPDIDNSVHIIAVGYAALKFGKKMWKVSTTCVLPKMSSISLSPKKSSSSLGMMGEDVAHRRKTAIDQQNDREVGQVIEKYNSKMLHLTGTRTVTHMFVHQVPKEVVFERPEMVSSPKKSVSSFTPSGNTSKKFDFSSILNSLEEGSVESSSLASSVEFVDEPTSVRSECGSVSSMEGEMMSPGRTAKSVVPNNLNGFVEDRDILLFCGHDDGTVAVVDLTLVMWEINIRALADDEFLYNTYLYNCKQKLHRKVRKELVERCTWTSADAERVRIVTRQKALLESHWTAHLSNVVSLSIIGDKKYLLTSSEDSGIKMFTVEGADVAVLTRGRTIDGILRTEWVSPIDIVARNERRAQEALDFVQANSNVVKIMPRATYITQQMQKRPDMFEHTDVTKLLLSSQVFDENHASIREDKVFDVTFPPPAENKQPSMDTFSTFSTFFNDPDCMRKSVLGQLNEDSIKRGDESTKLTHEDDSDLESLATSARGALNKAAALKRKKMVEKREKRYYDSVTLDANELISDIANEAIMRGSASTSFPSGMSSASVVEHQRQLEHNRLKIEAAKQASFRQKALYPSMYSERMQRQRLAELSTRSLVSTIVLDEGAIKKEIAADVNASGDTQAPTGPSKRIPPLDLGSSNPKTGPGNPKQKKTTADSTGELAGDSCMLQTFNLGTSEMLNSSTLLSSSMPQFPSQCQSQVQVQSRSTAKKERQALYNSAKTNTTRSNLLIGKVLQSKKTASIGEELKLTSLQSSLESFDRKMNSVDFQARTVMASTPSNYKFPVLHATGIAAGDDTRLDDLGGHHSHAALARIGSISSIDGAVALNPSEIIDTQSHTLRRRDDILPTRNASNFGAQMLNRSNFSSADIPDADDEVDVPESNWMKKVRALLVLGETTDYLESDSSVSGDHVVNMVEKFP